MKTQKKIQYLRGIIMAGIMAVFAGCGFFEEGASITVSVDADSLRKFVNENVTSNVTKGDFEANETDALSLRVVLTGDENGVYTEEISHAPSYASSVSIKIDGLRIGAKIKVRVELIKDEKIILAGGTKSFAVSAGGNKIAVPMGNYSDIIVWNKPDGVYYRGDIENNFVSVNVGAGVSSPKNMAFDSGNSSLNFVYNLSWYNTSYRQDDFTSNPNTLISSSNPVIAAHNGSLYYCKGDFDISINILRQAFQGTSEQVCTLASDNSSNIAITALALSEDGKKAYAAYTVRVDQSSNEYEYCIMSFDVSNGSWIFSSKVPVAQSGNFIGSDINYKNFGVDGFLTNGFKITDIKAQDGYVWVLVREGQGDTNTYGISRGALIRYNTSLGARKVFGWTADDKTAQASANPYHYRVPPHPDSTNFFGPIKFVGSRPEELVIADDGYFMGYVSGAVEKRNINRVIFFNTKKESVSTVRSLDSSLFDFDYSYSSDFDEVNKPDKNPLAFEGGDGFKMKPVHGGTFQLCKDGDIDGTNLVNMTISKDYFVAETEVTQELWAAVMTGTDNNPYPSSGKDNPFGSEIQGKRPVECVSWYDAIEFCNRLSELNGKEKVYTIKNISRNTDGSISSADVEAFFSKNGYRLPTEMEWMWAAMGATDDYTQTFAGGSIPGSNLDDYVWHRDNSSSKTHQVRLKEPNALGLYDMSGNVYEWCWDLFEHPYNSISNYGENDYTGPESGTERVRRGGSYSFSSVFCMVAKRASLSPGNVHNFHGFRVVRNAD